MAETETTPKKFYRTKDDRVIAGVCGGIARYLELDPTLVRILWVVLTLLVAFFPGLLAYAIFWFAAPEQ